LFEKELKEPCKMGAHQVNIEYYLKRLNYLKIQVILVLLLLSSCTAPLYFEKTEPPEISLEIKPCRIAVVNIYDYTEPQTVRAENQKVYRNAINKFGLELSKIGATDSLYKFFFADSLFKGISPENQSLVLPVDTIHQLTSVYKADYLLTTDSVSFFLQEDEPDESDESGIRLALNNFYLIADFFLSLYDNSGNIIDRTEVSMATKYATKIMMTYFSDLQPSFSKATVQAGELGISAADDYADRFYPVKTQEQRYVYSGGKFRKANELMVKEKWDKALEILNHLASSPKPALSEKAEHNLSVLKEVQESVPGTIRKP
jgi:hypothetical protein